MATKTWIGQSPQELTVVESINQTWFGYRRTHRPSIPQEKVLRNIATCRTASLGGHVDECHSCGYERISYNSCRDRHCPKCQNVARAEWLESRLERLLPVPYFHVVFTIPGKLNPVALRNKKVAFDILFAAAAQTLLFPSPACCPPEKIDPKPFQPR